MFIVASQQRNLTEIETICATDVLKKDVRRHNMFITYLPHKVHIYTLYKKKIVKINMKKKTEILFFSTFVQVFFSLVHSKIKQTNMNFYVYDYFHLEKKNYKIVVDKNSMN